LDALKLAYPLDAHALYAGRLEPIVVYRFRNSLLFSPPTHG
jgi:hypothetical protein